MVKFIKKDMMEASLFHPESQTAATCEKFSRGKIIRWCNIYFIIPFRRQHCGDFRRSLYVVKIEISLTIRKSMNRVFATANPCFNSSS